ncbi:MAG: biopolymer transporter ExbD [Myxococcota bacterium]
MNVRRHLKKKGLTLQVTSLLDMFTIILVFLMVSFQAEDQEFILNPGVVLPSSDAKSPLKPAVNVAVTSKAVFVDGKQVYELTEENLGEIAQGVAIKPISEAVEIVLERLQEKEDIDEGVVVVQADKETPYPTLYAVLQSASAAGLYRYRLVVEKE